MQEPSQRFWDIFFELYEGLPRQGPGNRANAERALALCRHLPRMPAVLDLGCGVGGQTLHLAELLPDALITAVDNHGPNIERLRAAVAQRRLGQRIRPLIRDMASSGLEPGSFDLVWSEGALYNLGIDRALRVCGELLRAGGYLAFTEAVWRKENPPPEVKASFEDYPGMGWVPDVQAAIHESGFSLVGHFTLPDEAWWDDFYAPMESRIEEMRSRYSGDDEALGVLAQLAQEPEMHRGYSEYYAYEFFVVRRPSQAVSPTTKGWLPSD